MHHAACIKKNSTPSLQERWCKRIKYIKNTSKRNMSSAVCLPAMCKSSLFLRLSLLLRSIFIFEVVLLLSKVRFHQRSPSIKGCLPSKVVFHQWSSSIEGRLPLKVVFHWRLSSSFGSFSFLGFSPECGIAQLSLSLFVSLSWSTSMTSIIRGKSLSWSWSVSHSVTR